MKRGDRSMKSKLEKAIEKARHTDLVRLIYGLGIPNIGLANAKLLVKHFKGNLDELEILKKELSQYVLKPEYLTFEYSDEAAKSPIFNLYSRKYFNRKTISQSHLTIEHITDLYERY